MLIVFGLLSGSGDTYARPDFHFQFSTLPRSEQRKMVLETMRLVVEIEGQYRFESLKKSANPSKLKKYSFLLKKAQEFLIGSAHAASSYTPRFQNFQSLLSQPDKCVYGGWISGMKNNFCTHPLNLPVTSPERRAYSSQGCRFPQEISCNPLIFGHKTKANDSLFCVPAGVSGNNAHNSSLRCMEKALSEEGDGAELRLQYLAEEIAQNPAQAQSLFEFISRACICAAELPGLNERYHRYMQPHRTCYALMKTLASSSNACASPPVLGDNHALIQSLGTMIIPAYEAGGEAQVDSYYVDFLKGLRISSEFRNFCAQDQLDSGDDAGTTTGGDSSGGETGTQSSAGAGGSTAGQDSDEGGSTTGSTSGTEGGDQGLQSADPSETSGETTGSSGGTAGNSGGTTLVATQDPEVPDSGATAGGSAGGPTDTPTTDLPGSPGGAAGGPDSDPLPPTEGPTDPTPGEPEATSPLSLVVEMVDQTDSVAQLEAVTTPKDLPEGVILVWFAKGEKFPEADPTSADPDVKENDTPVEAATPVAPVDLTGVNLGPDEQTVEGQRRYTLSNRMITVDKIDGTYQMCAKLVKDAVIVAAESCVEINGDDADDDVPVEPEPSSEKKKYKLTLTPSGKDPIKLKAKTDPEERGPNAKIRWFKRSPKAKEEKKKPKGSAADLEASDDDGEEKPADEEVTTLDEAKKTEIDGTEDAQDIDVKLEDTEFEVCAVVVEEKEVVSNVACDTIPKKSADRGSQRPMGPYMPQQQGPQMIPLRGGGDVMIRGVY